MAHGLLGAANSSRNLTVVALLDHSGMDGHTLILRKPRHQIQHRGALPDELVDPLEVMVVNRLAGNSEPPARALFRAPPAFAIPGLVPSDRAQPRQGGRLFGSISRSAQQRGSKHLRCEIGREFAVAGLADEHGEHAREVTSIEQSECRPLAHCACREKRCVIDRVSGILHL